MSCPCCVWTKLGLPEAWRQADGLLADTEMSSVTTPEKTMRASQRSAFLGMNGCLSLLGQSFKILPISGTLL